VWLPHWPITRLRRTAAAAPQARERPINDAAAQRERPLVTVDVDRGQRVLAEVAPEADGLEPGQTLAAARAQYPGLIALEADHEGDEAALDALAAWATRYTPLVAPQVMGAVARDYGLWLDIAGCAHLFARGSEARAANIDGEAALVADLRARLARHGIPARLALAGTTGAAWALARSPTHDGASVLSGQEQAALATLPVAALRLDARAVSGLRRLGVREVAALARLPREDITARFGPMPVLRLDQAFGKVEEVIPWRHDAAPWREMLAFPEPIGTAEDLAQALGLLSGSLCARLAAAGQGGLRFTARFFRVDNTAREASIGTARPVRDAAYVAKLLGAKLESIDPGFGVEAMTLEAEATAEFSAVQAEAFAVAEELDKVATVVDRIANDIGPDNVWRPAPFASHVPERAVRREPPLHKSPSWERDPTQPRPIRLLKRPEPIDVTAPVPDDPPILFRWRKRVHRIRAATGPERIAAEWWRSRQRSASDQNQERKRQAEREETDLLRDYYQVEDTDGARFWVFRAGLHGSEAHTPRWFLHGLFG